MGEPIRGGWIRCERFRLWKKQTKDGSSIVRDDHSGQGEEDGMAGKGRVEC
jgi:hypothetical protein